MAISSAMTAKSLKVGGKGRSCMSHVEPALRPLADVSGHIHDDQQQDADRVGERREQAQILRRRQPRQREHGGDRDGDVDEVMFDHLQVLSGRAVDDQNADRHDDREYAGQGAVEPEGAKGAAARGQRAPRA